MIEFMTKSPWQGIAGRLKKAEWPLPSVIQPPEMNSANNLRKLGSRYFLSGTSDESLYVCHLLPT